MCVIQLNQPVLKVCENILNKLSNLKKKTCLSALSSRTTFHPYRTENEEVLQPH